MLTDMEKPAMEQVLESLFDRCSVIDAAVVSTPDGRLFVEKQRGSFPVERAAVMGSSLMALGDAIASEMQLGTCDIVISENSEGIVVFNHIADSLVLVCLTKSKNGLGTLLSWARKSAQEIAQQVAVTKM